MSETVIFLDSKRGRGSGPNFTVELRPPILLDKDVDYQVASDIWYSWYNITPKNNLFRYFNDTEWKKASVSSGAYNIDDLNLEIKRIPRANGDDKCRITMQANYNTLKSRILLKDGYRVDFKIGGGLRNVLGFKDEVVEENGAHNSARQVNITNIHSVLIRCSLISSSYMNASTGEVIYSFSPKKPPGSLLSINPNQLVYVRMSKREELSNIIMSVTDQDGRPIDLNGERTTFTLHIKAM